MRDFYRNSEGYSDPTAFGGLSSAVSEDIKEADERMNLLIKTVKNLIHLAGFELVSRIEVEDKKTGKQYR